MPAGLAVMLGATKSAPRCSGGVWGEPETPRVASWVEECSWDQWGRGCLLQVDGSMSCLGRGAEESRAERCFSRGVVMVTQLEWAGAPRWMQDKAVSLCSEQ